MSTSTFKWSTPATLSSLSVNSSDPRVIIDPNGNIVATWIENGFIKSSTKLVNNNWSSSVTLSNSGASLPNIIIDNNGNATTLWVENGIIKTSSKTLSGNWTTSITLSSTGANSPDLAVDINGNLIAVWTRSNNIESSTKLFGMSWQNKVIISSTTAVSPHIAIGGSGSNIRAIIVWHSTSTNLVYTSTKLITGSWSTAQAISDSTRLSAYANIAMDSNANANVLWYTYNLTGNLYSNVIVQSICRPNISGVWSSITDLSSAGIHNPADLASNVKFDGNGNTIAVWNTSFDGSTFTVQSALKPVRAKWMPATDV